MKIQLVITGYGGQGIKFLSTILAKAYIKDNKYVSMLVSYGPEARGGASAAFLTISNEPIVNPIITNPDWLVAFNKEALSAYKDKSTNIIFDDDQDNMVMLGKLIKKLNINIDIVIETLKHQIDDKYKDKLEKNIENLKVGYARI